MEGLLSTPHLNACGFINVSGSEVDDNIDEEGCIYEYVEYQEWPMFHEFGLEGDFNWDGVDIDCGKDHDEEVP